uniref:Receptor expression-enhancing protein n=1 Tax=Amphimedon queenslandica TaxID=400682 RepID=A0A1X7UU63_AMPQE
MKDFVLLALALSFFLSCGVTYGKYVKVSNCKNVSESCLYQYHARMELGKGEQVSVSAKVEISCESVGTFNNELSIRSCMQVRDSVITKTSEDSNNDLVPVEKLDKWFCFAQSTSSGKVLGVFYGKGEEEWVVNFKRSNLDLTLTGQISGQMEFNAFIARLDNDVNMKASAMLETGPTLTVKGEASAKILAIFKIGMEVSGSITYLINPEASTSVCGPSPNGDANACFEVYGTTEGNIAVEAFWQSRCTWYLYCTSNETILPFLSVIVGVLYPAYCSFKAVKYKDHREYTTWMMYWIVFAIFLTAETFSDVFLSWLPFYYEIKIVIVIWLALPYTQGAKTLYRRLIHHKLVDSENQIDEFVSNAGQVSFGLVRKASSVVVNHASEGIMTAAMRISRQEERRNSNNLAPPPEEPMVVRETMQQEMSEDFVQVNVPDSYYVDSYKKE